MPIFKRSPIWLGDATWANRAVSPPNNSRQFISDVVPGGADMRYDASRSLWVPVGGALALFDATLPVGIAPPGTMGNNGAVTFSTALPGAFAGGYLYFAVNTIATGVAAGFYWTVPSTTTAAVVYNNTYTPGGTLTRPTSPTAFVTTGPGLYAAVTTEITTHSVTLKGGLLGPNGRLLFSYFNANDTAATTKTWSIKLGASAISLITTSTTPGFYLPQGQFANRNNVATNIATNYAAAGNTATYAPLLRTVDTSVDITVTHTMQFANNQSSGFVDFLHFRVEPA